MGQALMAALVGLMSMLLTAPSSLAADPIRVQPRIVDAAGTSFAYDIVGSGPLLLMLNGTASPMNEWDPALLLALAVNHRVIVVDYPGIGLSGKAPGRWDFDAAAGWFAQFLDVVAPGKRVDVLGWSMGGFIAQRLAIEYPGQVRRLVLAATNPGGSTSILGPEWVQEADSSGGLGSYLLTNYPRGQRDAGRRFIARVKEAVARGDYPDEVIPSATRRAMVRAEDPWLRSNVNTRQLSLISAPALVITGAADVVTPPGNSRRIAAAIPGAHLVLVPGAGHSFLFQRPAATARIITQFLKG